MDEERSSMLPTMAAGKPGWGRGAEPQEVWWTERLWGAFIAQAFCDVLCPHD